MTNNYLLSICVCSLIERNDTFYQKILHQLKQQIKGFENEVQLVINIDNGETILGTKRNQCIDSALGKYVIFVDDDDIISNNYISTLIETIKHPHDVDVISFIVNVSLNNGPVKPCYYSITYKEDYNEANSYHRLPNHICAIKTEIAKAVGFKPILYAEDADFSKRAKEHLHSEIMINETLYYYNFNSQTTSTRGKR
jgi:glycosyltransferase involved in cell wall biosynthesis